MYRVKDHLGYTKLLIYERKYNADLPTDTAGVFGGYEDMIRIGAVGEEKK